MLVFVNINIDYSLIPEVFQITPPARIPKRHLSPHHPPEQQIPTILTKFHIITIE
jgi:hypothetical protein